MCYRLEMQLLWSVIREHTDDLDWIGRVILFSRTQLKRLISSTPLQPERPWALRTSLTQPIFSFHNWPTFPLHQSQLPSFRERIGLRIIRKHPRCMWAERGKREYQRLPGLLLSFLFFLCLTLGLGKNSERWGIISSCDSPTGERASECYSQGPQGGALFLREAHASLHCLADSPVKCSKRWEWGV